MKDFFKPENLDHLTILVDTREQQPLPFKNQKIQKLYVGDYSLDKDNYNYIYVDRKSEDDFISTLCKANLERFKEELNRARELKSFIFVVTESSIDSIINNHKIYKKKGNLNYAFKNMKLISHEYRDVCQFVFSGSRQSSLNLIPKILKYGKEIMQTDLQYYIDNELGRR